MFASSSIDRPERSPGAVEASWTSRASAGLAETQDRAQAPIAETTRIRLNPPDAPARHPSESGYAGAGQGFHELRRERVCG